MWTFVIVTLILIDVIAISILSVKEENLWAAALLLASGVGAWFLGVPIIEFAQANWQWVLGFLGAYLFVGVGWSMVKWWFKVRDARNHLRKFFEKNPKPVFRQPIEEWHEKYRSSWSAERRAALNHAERTHMDPPPEKQESHEEFRSRVADWMRNATGFQTKPYHAGGLPFDLYVDKDNTVKVSISAGDNKARIIGWMSLWPFSMLGTLVDDLLLRLWQRIYEVFSGVYQRISDKVLGDLNK